LLHKPRFVWLSDSSSYLLQFKERKINMYNYLEGCDCDWCRSERAREEADKGVKTPAGRLLTLDMVLRTQPCWHYRNLFRERYGNDGVMVTVEKALSELEDWDWYWAGTHLLSRKAEAEFSRRFREAEKAYATAMQPYWDLVNAAYDKYYAARGAALEEARSKGLSYTERYGFMDKASEGILTIPQAAADAASKIADRRLITAKIIAFAELFIADEEAYNEEHKDDGPVYDPDLDEDYNEDDDY
jgi:hypothetical protein